MFSLLNCDLINYIVNYLDFYENFAFKLKYNSYLKINLHQIIIQYFLQMTTNDQEKSIMFSLGESFFKDSTHDS